jgi:hypothetical protein
LGHAERRDERTLLNKIMRGNIKGNRSKGIGKNREASFCPSWGVTPMIIMAKSR